MDEHFTRLRSENTSADGDQNPDLFDAASFLLENQTQARQTIRRPARVGELDREIDKITAILSGGLGRKFKIYHDRLQYYGLVKQRVLNDLRSLLAVLVSMEKSERINGFITQLLASLAYLENYDITVTDMARAVELVAVIRHELSERKLP